MKRTLLMLALAAAIGGCRKKEPPKPQVESVTLGAESAATVQVTRVSSGPMLSGTLQPQQSATILAETGGTVVSMTAAEGQRVVQGVVLARIRDDAAGANVQSAQTAVQSGNTAVAMARRDLDRAEMLAKAGAVPKRDVDVARSQVANAQAQLAQAQAQLTTARDRMSNQVVVASTTGVISERRVSEGDLVTPGTPLFTIVDLTTLQLEASVSSEALQALRVGDAVQFDVRGFPQQRFNGTIRRIAPTVDPTTGQVRVYVSVLNDRQQLVGGLFAEGTVTTMSRQGIVIPIQAVDETGTSPWVLRLRNGVAERAVVRLGIRNEKAGTVEVVSGLSPGEQILVGPSRTITPGTRVTIGNAAAAR